MCTLSLHRSREGGQGAADEEEDERSSGSSIMEKEYFNPMLLDGGM